MTENDKIDITMFTIEQQLIFLFHNFDGVISITMMDKLSKEPTLNYDSLVETIKHGYLVSNEVWDLFKINYENLIFIQTKIYWSK